MIRRKAKAARLRRYAIASPRWQAAPLRIAVISDLHIGAPWTPLDHLSHWVTQVNALAPDVIIQAGDLLLDRKMRPFSRPAAAHEITEHLRALSAPLGVWSVMGNHDWTDCDLARQSAGQRNSVIEALEAAQLPVLENRAMAVMHDGQEIWLVGLGSQMGRRFDLGRGAMGNHDHEAAFRDVPDGASAILLAHEPDIFETHDSPVALQISGHTHGGQIAPFGWRPYVPSRYGARYAHGHHRKGARHLVVSGGLGYSGVPLRLGVPPEIVLIHISST